MDLETHGYVSLDFFHATLKGSHYELTPPYPSPVGEGNKFPLLAGEGKGEVAFVVAQFIGHS
jgi:hypothetical protein